MSTCKLGGKPNVILRFTHDELLSNTFRTLIYPTLAECLLYLRKHVCLEPFLGANLNFTPSCFLGVTRTGYDLTDVF